MHTKHTQKQSVCVGLLRLFVLRFGFDCLKTIELFGSLLFPLFLGMYTRYSFVCACFQLYFFT